MKRRSSSLRSMPVTRDSQHSLYIEIASLQMARSRHQKIRDSLLVQLRKAEEQMALADQQIAAIKARLDALNADPGHVGSADDELGDDQPFVFDY